MKCPSCSADKTSIVSEAGRLRCEKCGAVGHSETQPLQLVILGAVAGGIVSGLVIAGVTSGFLGSGSTAAITGAAGAAVGATTGALAALRKRFVLDQNPANQG
jgi:hypothetical protein